MIDMIDSSTTASTTATSFSYTHLFRRWYQYFPKHSLNHCRRVLRCYKRYVQYFAEHESYILATFNDGIEESLLETLDSLIALPMDYRIWLRLCDGQSIDGVSLDDTREQMHVDQPFKVNQNNVQCIGRIFRERIPAHTRSQIFRCGILGGFKFYDNCFNIELTPITMDSIEEFRENLPSNSIPIFHSLTPTGPEGTNQPIYYLHSDGHVTRPMGLHTQHRVASSFIEFMEQHIDRLENSIFPANPEGGISRFATRDPCGSDCTTKGIRVSVSVLWIPEFSQQGYHMFAYNIRMQHTGETDTRARLQARRWRIKSGTELEKEVQGPGVIGLYPYMYPGCPPFEYASCCPIRSNAGSMYGSFQFMDTVTQEIFDVEVGEFIFDINRNFI
jgi:ApaG protein